MYQSNQKMSVLVEICRSWLKCNSLVKIYQTCLQCTGLGQNIVHDLYDLKWKQYEREREKERERDVLPCRLEGSGARSLSTAPHSDPRVACRRRVSDRRVGGGGGGKRIRIRVRGTGKPTFTFTLL